MLSLTEWNFLIKSMKIYNSNRKSNPYAFNLIFESFYQERDVLQFIYLFLFVSSSFFFLLLLCLTLLFASTSLCYFFFCCFNWKLFNTIFWHSRRRTGMRWLHCNFSLSRHLKRISWRRWVSKCGDDWKNFTTLWVLAWYNVVD